MKRVGQTAVFTALHSEIAPNHSLKVDIWYHFGNNIDSIGAVFHKLAAVPAAAEEGGSYRPNFLPMMTRVFFCWLTAVLITPNHPPIGPQPDVLT